jgi:hypothetical protein
LADCGEKKKFAQRWIGPYIVTKVINDQSVELQIPPKITQVHSAYRLKKFINPANSKFLDEEKRKRRAQRTEQMNFKQTG